MKVRIGKAVITAGVSWAVAAGLMLSAAPAQADPAGYVYDVDISIESYVVDTGLQAVGSVPPEKLVGSVPPEKLVAGSVPPEKLEASVPPEKLVGSVPPEK